MIEIIAGGAIDVAAIMPVMAAAFDAGFGEAWTAAQCTATLAMPGSHLFIARYNDKVAGFALCRSAVDDDELLLIAVVPEFRRRNIGSQLLQHLIANAKSRNMAQLLLEMREGNPASFFYNKAGFKPIGRRPNYYSGPGMTKFDAITMAIRF